jgi:hypothetical protein
VSADRPRRIGLLAACALGLAAALPAVWWEPLHLDEAVTLTFAHGAPWNIAKAVFIDRGGAPVHFFVVSATRGWPGGVEGLRLPSLLCFLLALPLAGAIARKLADQAAALALPLLLALAPLAVELATFGRMYSLFLVCVLGATYLCLRAAASGDVRDWILAGAAAGALVYVHPIAPLYAPLVLATGLAVMPDPSRDLVRRIRPAVAATLVVALPYLYALAVLRSRYHVGEAARVHTTAGRSVAEESLHALTPAHTTGAVIFGLLAIAGIAELARRRPRVALVLALWVVVPVAFFSLVPARTRFFGRYLLPTLPFFLLSVIVGCIAIAQHLRWQRSVTLVLVAALLALEAVEVTHRDRTIRRLDLPRLVHAYAPYARGAVLFSSTGSPRTDRPPELLDDYVALEAPGAARVEELPALDPRFETGLHAKGVARVRTFLAGDTAPHTGIWIFRGKPRRVAAAARRLAAAYAVRRPGSELLLVMTRQPEPPRALVEDGLRIRHAWGVSTPADRWPRTIAEIDRDALR